MKDIYKKLSYVQGLADGMNISEKSEEGKLLKKVLELLEDLTDAVDDVLFEIEEQDERICDLEDDLDELEEDLYEDEDDEDFDDDDSFLEFDSYDDEDESEFFEIQCPNCGEDVMIDFDLSDPHTFSLLFLPRKPVGLTSRMMISRENSMASV